MAFLSFAVAVGRRDRREERLDQPPVRAVVEVLLEDLARARDRQVDRLAPQLGDRAVALRLDLATRALEHLLLLAPRLLEQVGPHLLGRLAPFGNEALRLGPRVLDLTTMLLEQLRGFIAIALGGGDRLLERALARLDRLEDRRERVAAKQEEKEDEKDERPEHEGDLEAPPAA